MFFTARRLELGFPYWLGCIRSPFRSTRFTPEIFGTALNTGGNHIGHNVKDSICRILYPQRYRAIKSNKVMRSPPLSLDLEVTFTIHVFLDSPMHVTAKSLVSF